MNIDLNAYPLLPSRRSCWQLTYARRGSGRTLHDALYHHSRDAREDGLGLWGRQHVDDRVRPLRLLLRLGVATAEDIPELTWLLMQIGEHLAQILRVGRHLSRELYAARRGSLLQWTAPSPAHECHGCGCC